MAEPRLAFLRSLCLSFLNEFECRRCKNSDGITPNKDFGVFVNPGEDG